MASDCFGGAGMPRQRLPVVVGLSGGLGNQMFQYAAGRALSLRLDCPLELDLSWFQGRSERQFALSPFNIQGNTCLASPWLPASAQMQVSRIARRWMPRIMGVPVFREPHFHYCPEFALLESPRYLEGYWQSERYFLDIRSELLSEFSLLNPMSSECLALAGDIRGGNSICVHVRRGDYVSNPVAAKTHGTCSLDYYLSGVQELSLGLDNPHCYVFSDDPAWVRSSLLLDCPMTVVDVNGPADAHLDLTLMAACRHFLIANSSLSWWAAWLGAHSEKKVLAPARWFLAPGKNTADLLPSTWGQR